MSRTLRNGVALRQIRSYYPSNQRTDQFDFKAEAAKWTDPSVKTFAVSELYERIEQPLSECEDIMSTWKETKWFNRSNDVTALHTETHLHTLVQQFLHQKYDLGEEANFLHRLLLQYALMRNGTFDNAFHGYFRQANGVIKYDTDPRWDTVKELIYTNVTVIDDLYHFSGIGGKEGGYRPALANMLASSLEHALPTGKSNVNDFAKVLFQYRKEDGVGVAAAPRLLASSSHNEGVDFALLLPHDREADRCHLALVIIGSENKYRRRIQVPDAKRKAVMATRAEKVFGLPQGSVDVKTLMFPPWLLDRHSLLKCHSLVGGLSPLYANWLPYYHYELTEHDPDWAYQMQKDGEDEYYQL